MEIYLIILVGIVVLLTRFRHPPFDIIPCSPFFIGLWEMASKTVNSFWISYLKLSNHEFCQLIKAAKHTEKVTLFNWCILSGNESNLNKTEGWKVKEIITIYEDAYDYYEDGKESSINILTNVLQSPSLIQNIKTVEFKFEYDLYDIVNELKIEAENILGAEYEEIKEKLKFTEKNY